jgi:hypothetical protein
VKENKQPVKCKVLTDLGQSVEDNGAHRDTEVTDGRVGGTERQWTGCTRKLWTQGNRNNRRCSVRNRQTVDRV